MNALTLFKKMKKMGSRTFSAKRVVLFLINRKLARAAGTKVFSSITNLNVDRGSRILIVESTREAAITTIVIRGYRFFTVRDRSYLGWDRLDINGPQRKEYLSAFGGVSRLEVPKSSVKYLETLL
jgi:hypothetical protein